MKNTLIFCLLLTILTSCSITKVANIWKDASRPALKATKVLVIFVTDHAPVQESFENAFVAKLQANNIEALASHKVLLTDKEIDKDFVANKVQTMGINGVFVTRIVGAKEKTVTDRSSSYKIPYAQFNIKRHKENLRKYGKDKPSGYIAMFDEISLKTTAYAVNTNEPVWFLESNTLLQETFDKLLDSYLEVIIANMRSDQII